MRSFFLAAGIFLAAAGIAAGQDTVPFRKEFSLELGTGLRPLHTTLTPSLTQEYEYAHKGQSFSTSDAYYPTFDITGALRFTVNSEFTFTVGVAWCHHKLYQHSTFGIDPDGNPRYNIDDKTLMGWVDSKPIYSFTAHWRYMWNPEDGFKLYSGIGLGFISYKLSDTYLTLIPSAIPVGMRYGGKHFYAFLETMMGPVATLVHGGLGWRF